MTTTRFRRTKFYEFDDMVDRSGGPEACWPWLWRRDSAGYGYGYDGDGPGDGAHRVAYRRAKGPIPKGQVVRHSCDNPPCCNPLHLSLGTYTDNLRDARERARWTPRTKATHCRKGHEFTPENTYERSYLKNGVERLFRYCRACRRI